MQQPSHLAISLSLPCMANVHLPNPPQRSHPPPHPSNIHLPALIPKASSHAVPNHAPSIPTHPPFHPNPIRHPSNHFPVLLSGPSCRSCTIHLLEALGHCGCAQHGKGIESSGFPCTRHSGRYRKKTEHRSSQRNVSCRCMLDASSRLCMCKGLWDAATSSSMMLPRICSAWREHTTDKSA